MSITAERKQQLIKEYRLSENDSGSVNVQAAVLTERIRNLTEHLKLHKKDFASRRGLLMLVGMRKRLINYLKGQDHAEYLKLIERLGLRK